MQSKEYFKSIYCHSLALLVDFYHLTMIYGYWKMGWTKKEAAFHLFFRRKPFKGEFAIAAGLEVALDYIKNFCFTQSDLSYLEQLKDRSGKPLFEEAFLKYLEHFSFSCNIDAMAEGTPVFPYEPIVRVEGPIIEAQLLEAPLLNIINFQTLIATKASRVCWAAKPDPVVEFGLRRAQGIDGAISASRAAFIGGCESTSHVLAGQLFGIPVRGTHAHSWIMAFDDEEESFRAYAEAMPKNCIFLVDTFDSIKGTKKAIKVSKDLKDKGVEMAGIRLDSGDLASLSIETRKLLDEAGFPNAQIMASNELDEYIIQDLKSQGAKINIWGVGTHLVTGKDQPALDGVYKLSAVRDPGGKWQPRLKISEQLAKVSNPGILQVRRFFDDHQCVADMIFDLETKPSERPTIIDPFDPIHIKQVDRSLKYKDLLIPVMRSGKVVYNSPSLEKIRQYCIDELAQFPSTLRRFLNPQPYFVGVDKVFHDKKIEMIEEIKRKNRS
ncbi:MAG TPA: nicotinate phosphoribosyltransferase [Rhabdochlamydiaceae bacterium]|nr:nicotinate phosphoribosyltransferase [Rhabdochlamydiaceae bacterium]